MTIDTIKHLGAEFYRAADSLADNLARLDNARLDRLAFLRRCSKDSTARLAAIKEELRTLPEQIAKWDAEAARLESQTAEDLLRQALDPAQEQPKPDPYRAGLPPERLRKVWAEWEMPDGRIYEFKGATVLGRHWDPSEPETIELWLWSDWKIRPHGATWARVEAMADEAEKPKCPACGKRPDRDALPLSPGEYVSCEVCGHYLRVGDGAVLSIVRPVENCGRVAANGTCGHPNAQAPTLLDLTKLPPGTVCEATGEIVTYLGRRIKPGEMFRIVEPDDELGDKHPTKIESDGGFYSVPALVPARVVEKPKGKGDSDG